MDVKSLCLFITHIKKDLTPSQAVWGYGLGVRVCLVFAFWLKLFLAKEAFVRVVDEHVTHAALVVFEEHGGFFTHGVATLGVPSVGRAQGRDPADQDAAQGADDVLVEVTQVQFEALGFAPDFASLVLAEVGEVFDFDAVTVGVAQTGVTPLVVFTIAGGVVDFDLRVVGETSRQAFTQVEGTLGVMVAVDHDDLDFGELAAQERDRPEHEFLTLLEGALPAAVLVLRGARSGFTLLVVDIEEVIADNDPSLFGFGGAGGEVKDRVLPSLLGDAQVPVTATSLVIPSQLAKVQVRQGELDHDAFGGGLVLLGEFAHRDFQSVFESLGARLEKVGDVVSRELLAFELGFDSPQRDKPVELAHLMRDAGFRAHDLPLLRAVSSLFKELINRLDLIGGVSLNNGHPITTSHHTRTSLLNQARIAFRQCSKCAASTRGACLASGGKSRDF